MTYIDKLIADGLWRSMDDCPDGAEVITKMKHGIVSGEYTKNDGECYGYYWQDMCWMPHSYMPIDTAPKLANALKVAVEALNKLLESQHHGHDPIIVKALAEIERIAKGE